MSEQESPTIDYKAEYEKLTKQVETATGESTRRKAELKELRTEMEGLRTKASEAETLRGELRLTKHRDGLKSLYSDEELGLNSKIPVEKLMKLIDYKPESDEFDAAAVKEKLAALKESDSYIFVEKSGEEPVTPQPPAPKWANRGASDAKTVKNTPLTEAQMRDPAYMAAYFKAQSKK